MGNNRTVRLYFLTSEIGEARILDRGFIDRDVIIDQNYNEEYYNGEDEPDELEGVPFFPQDIEDGSESWRELINCEVGKEGAGECVIAVDFPADLIGQYMIENKRSEDQSLYPRYIIPLDLANQHLGAMPKL